MKNKNIFLYIGLFWLIIVVGFIGVKEFTLKTGRGILLKTVPVDPRDLFRGDYVILSYDISTVSLSKKNDYSGDLKVGDNIYLTLVEKEGYAISSGIYKKIPDKSEIFIKGRVNDINNSRISVVYGIESYFVPERTGKEIERDRGKNLTVKVSVDRFGNAVIKSLVKKGR